VTGECSDQGCCVKEEAPQGCPNEWPTCQEASEVLEIPDLNAACEAVADLIFENEAATGVCIETCCDLTPPPPEPPPPDDCSDGLDNDRDTFIDGSDEDCGICGDEACPVLPPPPPPR
jgi:hypothetical protein